MGFVALLMLVAAAPVVGPSREVLAADFPDPFVLTVGPRRIAYATNSAGGHVNVQLADATELRRWRLLRRDALPRLPGWARRGFTWAPEVAAVPGGHALYFTARERKSGLQCVGVALSADPLGPFRSDAAAPLVCQRDQGGSIDASPFTDTDGQRWLLFKNDGNHPSANTTTRIWIQPLDAAGTRLQGRPVALAANDAAWKGRVIEAPTMVRRGGELWLFYSAGDYGWPGDARLSPYGIGVAACESPTGPCRDLPGNPILKSSAAPCLSGPGHQSVVEADGARWLVHHAWRATRACRDARAGRSVWIAPLSW